MTLASVWKRPATRRSKQHYVVYAIPSNKGLFSMLVLSRKKNESIVINDDITIVVVEIRGDKVRLGVEAPKEVPVHRQEVFEAIHRNDKAASAVAI